LATLANLAISSQLITLQVEAGVAQLVERQLPKLRPTAREKTLKEDKT
jgi:hypothetical protein